MKYFLLSCLMMSQLIRAQESGIKSTIKSVTVFLSGAQINREAPVKLKKGNNEVRLVDLSRDIDPNSIQVEGNTAFTIVSVSHETNYMENTAEPVAVKINRKKLEGLENQKKKLDDQYFVLQAEKEMILTNQDIQGTETGVDRIELVDIANFYRRRLNEIDFAQLELVRQDKNLRKEIIKYQKQIREQGYKLNQPTGVVVVKLSADAPKQINLNFNYIVSNAGWSPFYDIRSTALDQPIHLTYKGNVYQNTGYDWNKVKLTLSTGNPSLSNTKPEVSTWYLNAYNTESVAIKSRKESGKRKTASAYRQSDSQYKKEEYTYENESKVSDYVSVKEAGVSTEFDIALPYTIPSDGKKLAVEIQEHELASDYTYFAVPRLDPDAFLLSNITGWNELYLLAGEANIYNKGTYVGTSYINPQTADDTLELSLGRDNNLVVQRKKVKDLSSSTIFGSKRKTTTVIEISLKNTRSISATIKIKDQVPISADKNIKVEIEDLNGGKLNEDTGIISWNLNLGAGESKTIRFKYTVESEKSKYVRAQF